MTLNENEVVLTPKANAKNVEVDPNSPEQLEMAVPVQTKVQLKLNKIIIQLRNIPLLRELNQEDMNRIKADLRVRHYNRREVVLNKGGQADSLLFLLSGQLQVVDITEDGRAVGLRMLNPGDFFGEIALINSTTRSASVVAQTNVLVGFLPASTALYLFAHSPAMAKMMLQHLAQKIQRDSEFRALLSITNTSRRIFTFISMFKKTAPGGLEVIENLPTHQDIAMMINTSRETVTRALLYLVQQGIVEKDLNKLIIRQPQALQKLTEANPT